MSLRHAVLWATKTAFRHIQVQLSIDVLICILNVTCNPLLENKYDHVQHLKLQCIILSPKLIIEKPRFVCLSVCVCVCVSVRNATFFFPVFFAP